MFSTDQARAWLEASGAVIEANAAALADAGEATEVDDGTFAAALRAGLDAVVARGKAELEDKTMVDALTPAVDALDAALAEGRELGQALADVVNGRSG